jgi:hypothetical protein
MICWDFPDLMSWGGDLPEMVFGEHGMGWVGRVGIIPNEILVLICHDEMTSL